MYISTRHHIGDRVYFYDKASDCVTRGEVGSIHITQDKHDTRTSYIVNVMVDDGTQKVARFEDELFNDAGAAFRANPLPAPEVAEAA
jgi:hypothetical protein